MSLIIEGLIFPLGMLNLNDWGVPFTEEQNAVTTAKAAKVRVCSRIDPHICDVFGDPNSEIGGAKESWAEGEGENRAVYARTEIQDSVAAQKIDDGVWKKNWSVFISYQTIDASGWVHGVTVESITLVDNPAWPQATWNVVSASTSDKKYLRFITSYKVANKEGENIPKTTEELEAENAALKKEIEELKAKPKEGGGDPGTEEGGEGAGSGGDGGDGAGETGSGDAGTGEGGEGAGTAGTGEAAALKDENKRLKTQMATMLTKDEAKALIAEGIANDRKAEAAKNDREAAYNEFAAVRESLGKKTDPKDFSGFGASELRKFTEDLTDLKKAAASKGSGFSFTSTSGAKGGSTVGKWDSSKKGFVNSE